MAGAPHHPVDRFGTLASAACAVHCALGAAIPEGLAAFGLGAFLGHEWEWGFTVLALACAGAALVLGWRKHRSVPVASLLALGMASLLLARLLEDEWGEALGLSLSLLAGLLLVTGHVSNIRASTRAA
jgi:hypothetical protein